MYLSTVLSVPVGLKKQTARKRVITRCETGDLYPTTTLYIQCLRNCIGGVVVEAANALFTQGITEVRCMHAEVRTYVAVMQPDYTGRVVQSFYFSISFTLMTVHEVE